MTDIYETIRTENLGKYGTDINRYGPVLLSKQYSDRTHFIYELIQNAEDACQRAVLSGRQGPYKMHFALYPDRLEVRHNGIAFSDADVRGICGLVEGTKSGDVSQIGKFGIGFKSVYAYTTSPEVHSGSRNFLIRNYVFPEGISPKTSSPNETLFVVPFNHPDVLASQAFNEIAQRLAELGLRTLLFIKGIEVISWVTRPARLTGTTVFNSKDAVPRKGEYLKKREGEGMKRILLLRSEDGSMRQSEEWLTFAEASDAGTSRDIHVAYSVTKDPKTKRSIIGPVHDAKLFSFFETEKETHLKFLIHGRYNTTTARDNIMTDDWNRSLIERTGSLVSETIPQIKALGMLDVNLLNVLPIDIEHFTKGQTMFKPIYDKTQEKLKSPESLLPTDDGGYTSASKALLGRGKDLRKLLSPAQLALLFNIKAGDWLDDAISIDRTPELRRYLIECLGINELDPDGFARDLSKTFLEKQSDDWIIQFYGFLLDHEALWRKADFMREEGPLRSKPIIRLGNGSHVPPFKQDKSPDAYLPSKAGGQTLLPMVKEKIVLDRTARQFLERLGLSEPDLVASILEIVLPKYRRLPISLSEEENKRDVKLIAATLSSLKGGDARNSKLSQSLKTTPFLFAKNMVSGKIEYKQPQHIHLGEAYTGNDWAEVFFEGNSEIWLLEKRYKEGIGLKVLEQMGCLMEIQVTHEKPGYNGHVMLFDGWGYHSRGLDGFDPKCEIEGLQFALEHSNLEKSKIIWAILKKYPLAIRGVVENSYKKGFADSRREAPKFSIMGQLLADHYWLPGADGAFHKPSEMILSELLDEFDPDSAETKYIAQQLMFKSTEEEKLIEQLPEDRRGIYEGIKLATPETLEKIKQMLDAESKRAVPRPVLDETSRSSEEQTEERDAPKEKLTSFTSALFEAQTPEAPAASSRPISLPVEGPETAKSAVADTRLSMEKGRVGAETTKVVTRWELAPVGKALEEKFREMAKADYDMRCQICGATFQQLNRSRQAYIVHLLRPSSHPLSNQFGNLVSLCGWHYSLVRFGAWTFVNPETGKPAENEEQLKELILTAEVEIDEDGNRYFAIPIRFFNLYAAWKPEVTTETDAELRYSEPHWINLRELCNTPLGN